MKDIVRVLIIDDEPNLRTTLAMILRRAGYDVSVATCAGDVAQYLDDEKYDLFLLDVRLPDGNGLDLLPAIRRSNPGVPVLVLTAYAAPEVEDQAKKRGAIDFLVKPVDPMRIVRHVNKIVGQRFV
ncbi:MAG: response regulator [Anaerolineae bacterium]